MNANQLVSAITALAISLSETNTIENTAILGLFFTQLGDTLTTLTTQRANTRQTPNNGYAV